MITLTQPNVVTFQVLAMLPILLKSLSLPIRKKVGTNIILFPCRFCQSKTGSRPTNLKKKNANDGDFMPRVDIGELSPKELQEMRQMEKYHNEFGVINKMKRDSPQRTPKDPSVMKRNVFLGICLLSLVVFTYSYTVNQIARESYLDERLGDSTGSNKN